VRVSAVRIVIAGLAGAALVACGLSVIGTGETVGGPGSEAGAEAGGDATTSEQDGTAGLSDGGLDGCPSANVLSDPRNCGACGHDCLGGACQGGACQPFRIGMLDASATSIAVNDAGVYWVVQNGNAVLECPPQGCTGKPAILAGALNNTVAVVDVNGTLAVLDDGDLQAVTTPAGASVLIYPGIGTVFGSSALCTDGSGHAYFVTMNRSYADRLLMDGGNVLRIATSINIDALGCGAGHVLWEVNNGSDNIYSCEEPADCGAPALIEPGNNGGETHIIATADQAYFTRRQAGTLNRCSIAGCFAPTVLYTGLDLNGVAVDGKYVYFSSGKGGVIARCNQDGCGGASLHQLAVNQANPHALIADDKAIYWATDPLPSGGGDAGTPAAIYRLAK
jgi:hypothetical protein